MIGIHYSAITFRLSFSAILVRMRHGCRVRTGRIRLRLRIDGLDGNDTRKKAVLVLVLVGQRRHEGRLKLGLELWM
jgi:hypothetical protein